MDENNGTIFVASKLDFESKASYFIKLEAKDGGNKITEVRVDIHIIDDNDNPPIFDPPGTTSTSIDENQKNGFFVTVKVILRVLLPSFEKFGTTKSGSSILDISDLFYYQATDEDSGLNSAIKYSIVGGNPLNNFTIDQDTGNITNTGPLDFETQSKFVLTIMAKDQGTPSLNATKMVEITIVVSMKLISWWW